jgi:general secretion pathway protein K
MTGREQRNPEGSRGFALVAVLLVMSLLSVIGAEFAFSMRLEASMVRSFRDGVVASHLAEAGIEQAIREISSDSVLIGTPDDGLLTFFRTPQQPLPRLPREAVKLGAGEFSYRIHDEEARLNVNVAGVAVLDRFLTVLGLEKRVRDTIIDSLQDWKDANDDHRLNGAESDDTYLKLPVPYRARNGNLEDTGELLQIKGVTPEVYFGNDRQPGLVDHVTVHSGGRININTASEVVLRGLGLSDAEVTDIVQSRRATPYASVPGRFAGRQLVVATQTYRIEAEGRAAGEVGARITAIVRRRAAAGTGPTVVVLSWRPDAAPRKRS